MLQKTATYRSRSGRWWLVLDTGLGERAGTVVLFLYRLGGGAPGWCGYRTISAQRLRAYTVSCSSTAQKQICKMICKTAPLPVSGVGVIAGTGDSRAMAPVTRGGASEWSARAREPPPPTPFAHARRHDSYVKTRAEAQYLAHLRPGSAST
jgi:hypothetical protein